MSQALNMLFPINQSFSSFSSNLKYKVSSHYNLTIIISIRIRFRFYMIENIDFSYTTRVYKVEEKQIDQFVANRFVRPYRASLCHH